MPTESLWDQTSGKDDDAVPAGMLRTMAAFLPVAKSHSDTMQAGFASLSAFLGEAPSESTEPRQK